MSDATRTGNWANMEERAGEFLRVIPATAQGDAALFLIGVAPYAGVISEVSYYPNALITGANTHTRRHRLFNRKADASGTNAAADLQYNDTVNAAAKVKKVITLSGTAAHKVVAAGDVLEWASDDVGDGIADPGGLLVVKITMS